MYSWVDRHQTTGCHIPEDHNLHAYCRGKRKYKCLYNIGKINQYYKPIVN
jgi:hypothetical protein